MTTIVEAPPEPSHDDLQALIEEARRRARQRRLLIGGAIGAALLVGGVAIGLVLALRGGSGTAVPKGFHVVRARGRVHHALLHDFGSVATSIAVASGSTHPVKLTREIWWDPGTGLYRTLYRYDGLAMADSVRENCFTTHPRFCDIPSPFDLRLHGLGWPPGKGARAAGKGRFRGRAVVWVEGLVQPADGKPYLSGDQVGYDAVTHEPLVLRTIARSGPLQVAGKPFRGHVFYGSWLTFLPTLPGKDVSFVVPKGGASRNDGLKEALFEKTTIDRAADVIGRRPLWLGPSYRGHRLRFIQSAVSGSENAKGRGVAPVPFVRFDYGPFRIDEFGDRRPRWLIHGPPAGTLWDSRGELVYGRDGVLAMVWPFDERRPAALALVRSLHAAS